MTKVNAGEDEKLLIAETILQIARWKLKECPECGAPLNTINYVNKCNDYPDEHPLCDSDFYMKYIEKAWKKYLENKTKELKKK